MVKLPDPRDCNHVTIVRVADGVERVYLDTCLWVPSDEQGSGSIWWWTEGNGGCDCNRALFFKTAGAEDNEDDDTPCGESLYRIKFIELPDGTRIDVDAEIRPENAKSPSAGNN